MKDLEQETVSDTGARAGAEPESGTLYVLDWWESAMKESSAERDRKEHVPAKHKTWAETVKKVFGVCMFLLNSPSVWKRWDVTLHIDGKVSFP